MTPMQITDHARVRIQQRGIPEQVLPLLYQYGKKTYDHRGAQVLFMDKESRKRLERDHGKEFHRRFGDKLDIYAVLNENLGVITVGHRYRRINRR